jgi:esterase
MALSMLTVGDGPRTTVLLHGFLGSGRNLMGLARLWAARDPSRRFLLPDLTGHGSSPLLPPGATLETLSDDLLASLGGEDELELCGHSLGGRVALSAYAKSPSLVRGLVLLDIAPGPIPRRISESARVLEALLAAPATAPDRETMRAALARFGLSAGIVEWMLTNLRSGGEGYVWRIDARALHEALPRVQSQDLWPVVEQAHIPIHAVRGGRSPYVDDADVARLRASGVRVDTLSEAGHYVHVDAPAALVELLAGAPS